MTGWAPETHQTHIGTRQHLASHQAERVAHIPSLYLQGGKDIQTVRNVIPDKRNETRTAYIVHTAETKRYGQLVL